MDINSMPLTMSQAIERAESIRNAALDMMLRPKLSMKQLADAGKLVDDANEFIKAYSPAGINR